MSDKLLPCPFCGSPGAIIENIGRPKGESKKYHAGCNNPKCGLYGGLCSWHRKREDAVASWNRRAGGWIPTTERLPEAADGNYAGLILVFWDGWKMSTVTVQRMLQLQAEDGWNITHWMPLPAPPKEAANETV